MCILRPYGVCQKKVGFCTLIKIKVKIIYCKEMKHINPLNKHNMLLVVLLQVLGIMAILYGDKLFLIVYRDKKFPSRYRFLGIAILLF